MTVPYSLYDPSGNITALVEDADLNIDRAAAAAQAPVPQAIVSPEPRSQTRIRSVWLSITCTNSVLTCSGKIG